MMKGIRGTGYHDDLVVPVIPNTAHECDLADSMAAAIDAYPTADAVIGRLHAGFTYTVTFDVAKDGGEVPNGPVDGIHSGAVPDAGVARG